MVYMTTAVVVEIVAKLPPFRDYLMYLHETKVMALAASSITKHHWAELRDELFRPTLENNIASTPMAVEIAVGAANDLLEELRDPKKATSRHLSSLDGRLSWGKTTAKEHAAALGKLATDDPAESCHGATLRARSTLLAVSPLAMPARSAWLGAIATMPEPLLPRFARQESQMQRSQSQWVPCTQSLLN